MDKDKGRKIWKPHNLANYILKHEAMVTRKSDTELINQLIRDSKTPKDPNLKKKANIIFNAIEEGEELDQETLKDILVSTLHDMQETPIRSAGPFRDISSFFATHWEPRISQDYQFIVNQEDDEVLKQLEEELYFGNNEFGFRRRELVENYMEIMRQWERLCTYKTTYIALSVIARYTKMNVKVDSYTVINFLLAFDYEISNNPVDYKMIKGVYPKRIIPDEVQINALRHEIYRYYGNTSYIYLTGDSSLNHVPEEIRDLWYKRFEELNVSALSHKTTEEQLEITKSILRQCKDEFCKLKKI